MIDENQKHIQVQYRQQRLANQPVQRVDKAQQELVKHQRCSTARRQGHCQAPGRNQGLHKLLHRSEYLPSQLCRPGKYLKQQKEQQQIGHFKTDFPDLIIFKYVSKILKERRRNPQYQNRHKYLFILGEAPSRFRKRRPKKALQRKGLLPGQQGKHRIPKGKALVQDLVHGPLNLRKIQLFQCKRVHTHPPRKLCIV